jgi:hypothetical protein
MTGDHDRRERCFEIAVIAGRQGRDERALLATRALRAVGA